MPNVPESAPPVATRSEDPQGDQPAGRVNSHNEWGRLREVIVGTAQRTVAPITWPKAVPIPEDVMRQATELAVLACPPWYVDEVEEDLDGFCRVLEAFGARVARPSPHDLSQVYSSPFWASTSMNCYNARDLHLVVGNTVIESPSHIRSRYYETLAFRPIWYEYFKSGFRWIAAPRPHLDYEPLLPYFRDEQDRIFTSEDVLHQQLAGGRLEKLHRLAEQEILFEAANTLRMGRDLLYLVSASGNRLGARWLQSVLGDDYRVHTTEGIYRSSHIDSTVLVLRPGVVLLNSVRVNDQNCPRLFDGWQKIYFGEVSPVPQAELAFQKNVREPLGQQLAALGFQNDLHSMASPWVGMNVLSLDDQTVVVEAGQTKLARVLEHHGFTVVPVRMRHAYTQQGGLHCTTLDTVRDSKLESYFD